MTAEVLREAARLMRERAHRETDIGEDIPDALVRELVRRQFVHERPHYAHMTPAVALAVADWLDGVFAEASASVDNAPKAWGLDLDDVLAEDHPEALAVARAYLGGQP